MIADRGDADPRLSNGVDGGTGSSPAGMLYDEIVSQSIDAIIVTNGDLVVQLWSPGAERIYGVSAADAVGRHLNAVITAHGLDGRLLPAGESRASLEREGSWRQRLVHRPVIGGWVGRDVVVDSLVTPLHGQDGATTGFLSINRDVTTTARLENEIAALASLVGATDKARTPAEVAGAALDILCRATGADAGLVTSTDGGYEAIASRGPAQWTKDVILKPRDLGGPLAMALEAPDSYVSADVATAPLREDVRAAVLADGLRHLMVIGLRPSGQLSGLLALGWRTERPAEPTRTIMLQAAALVGSSIENARLLAAVESGLREERLLTRRMSALVELTRLPDAVGADRASLDRLVADLDEVIGADGTSLALLDGDRLVLAAVHRIDPAWAALLLDRPLSSVALAAHLVDGGQSMLIPLDRGEISRAAATAAATAGHRTMAAFAIRDDGDLVGMFFALFRRSVDELEIDPRTLDAIGRVLDISFANRRLREGLVASQRRYRELFDASPDALLVHTMDDLIVDANQAALGLYGAGLVGHHVEDLAVSAIARLDASAAPGEVTRATGIGRRLDGTTFPEDIELLATEIGGERRMLVIVRDLTERSRLQAELVQAQKMEAIGLLVAGVAHELNNPLASIVGFSHLIRTDPALPDDLRRQADMLVQEANRTRVIVQNLLDFARQRPPERVEMELRSLLDSVLGLQTYVLARNQLTVDIDVPADLPLLSVDRSQMQQVLINLTVNAAQAIHDAGRPGSIRIRARAISGEGESRVRIEIADDGPGVPAEIADRLFLPFVTTKAPGEGTGLGLSVSFGIVASHGGTLRNESNADGGATFVIELPIGREEPAGPEVDLAPIAAAPAATAPAAPAPASLAGSPARPERPIRILVLDDEPPIRDFLGRVLSRNGYEPVLVATGAAALDIIRADPPDAILCDHRMAGMSGTEFHAAVGEIAPDLARRFAFMSGDVLNPELRAFASERNVHLLAKPFDIATVAAIVSTLVGEPPA